MLHQVLAVIAILGPSVVLTRALSAECIPDNSVRVKIETTLDSVFSPETCSTLGKTGFSARFVFVTPNQIDSITVDHDGPNVMTSEEFKTLISKLSSIQNIGRSVRSGSLGVFTNFRTDVTDQYENAFIRSWQSPVLDTSNVTTDRILSFTIYYLHSRQVIVNQKRNFDNVFRDRSKLHQVGVGDDWYYVSESEFSKTKLKHKTTILVAGPIKY